MLCIRHSYAWDVSVTCAKRERPATSPQNTSNTPWKGQEREGSITSLVQCSHSSSSFSPSGTFHISVLKVEEG